MIPKDEWTDKADKAFSRVARDKKKRLQSKEKVGYDFDQ